MGPQPPLRTPGEVLEVLNGVLVKFQESLKRLHLGYWVFKERVLEEVMEFLEEVLGAHCGSNGVLK